MRQPKSKKVKNVTRITRPKMSLTQMFFANFCIEVHPEAKWKFLVGVGGEVGEKV